MPAEPISGCDSEGKEYDDINDMWKHELTEEDASGKKAWYSKAVDYWKQQPATVNGVLGGFEHVSGDDIHESAEFILPFLLEEGMERTNALDCGAGVGRIADRLLVKKLGFEKVNLLEPCAHMLAQARETIPTDKQGDFIEGSVQEFVFTEGVYDCIILQWVGIYLTDDDFITFIQNAKKSLRPNGIIFIKENSCSSGFLVDKEDSSLTRSRDYYRELITKAGGEIVKEGLQQEFPKDLFKVVMFAVK